MSSLESVSCDVYVYLCMYMGEYVCVCVWNNADQRTPRRLSRELFNFAPPVGSCLTVSGSETTGQDKCVSTRFVKARQDVYRFP